ncbi:MAG TPA: FAD-dependent oxidoreductase [Acidimicrobiales bacterium]|nr:FAD-dependent oxidoreductase [Acidimicrobiales bacterium]
MRSVAVVGASLAGVTAAKTLRQGGFEGDVVLVGKEPHAPYSRPPLSKEMLYGEWDEKRIALALPADARVDLRLGCEAASLDLAARRVVLDDGGHVDFDGLIIATGSEPRWLPVLGDRRGVHYLRTLDDARSLRASLEQPSARVVVVGGGFIGLEVAAAARQRGLRVTVLEALEAPLARVLGAEMGDFVAGLHRSHGVEVLTGVTVEGLLGDGRVESVVTDAGEIAADVVVVGVGARPVTGWLDGSGLVINDGVVCDRFCAALGAEGVFAAGDVARWHHVLFEEEIRVEHWDNAVAQGEVAARNLLAGPEGAVPFAPVPFFWSDQFDAKLQYVGHGGPHDDVAVVDGSPADGRFVATYTRAGRLVGALLVNRMSRMPLWRRAVGDGAAP